MSQYGGKNKCVFRFHKFSKIHKIFIKAIQESLCVMHTYAKEPWPELFCDIHQLYVLTIVWPCFCSVPAIATLAVNSMKCLLSFLSRCSLSLCTRCSVLLCLISKSLSRRSSSICLPPKDEPLIISGHTCWNLNEGLDCPNVPALVDVQTVCPAWRSLNEKAHIRTASCNAAYSLISSAVSGTCECLAACLGACWLCSLLCNPGAVSVTVCARARCIPINAVFTPIVPLQSLTQLRHSCTDGAKKFHRPTQAWQTQVQDLCDNWLCRSVHSLRFSRRCVTCYDYIITQWERWYLQALPAACNVDGWMSPIKHCQQLSHTNWSSKSVHTEALVSCQRPPTYIEHTLEAKPQPTPHNAFELIAGQTQDTQLCTISSHETWSS